MLYSMSVDEQRQIELFASCLNSGSVYCDILLYLWALYNISRHKGTFTCGNNASGNNHVHHDSWRRREKVPKETMLEDSEGFISHLLILEICFLLYVIRITQLSCLVLYRQFQFSSTLAYVGRHHRKHIQEEEEEKENFGSFSLFYSIFLAIRY